MSVKNFTIFIVEDEEFYGKMIEYHLSMNPELLVYRFVNAEELFENLYRSPDVITLDFNLPDIDGFTILKRLKNKVPEVPVIIVSGQEDIGIAVDLLRNGAYDYVVKNEDSKERIWNAISKIKENQDLKEEITVLREEVRTKYEFQKSIIGESPVMQRVFQLMEKAASSTITVSLFGETGTGKELVAKSIHYNSPRSNKKFEAVNLGAIPENLIESELFGHEKGAFTGAINRRIGKFEEASGGTLFLDEIGEMPLNMQVKLLRALQEQEVTRIGGNDVIKIDSRIIVATHKNLIDLVQQGLFREDLYYRILGLNILLPPLRERGSDIIIMAKSFVDEYCKKNKLNKITISNDASQKLLSYSFPGNVRELKAVIELACVMSNDDVITENEITFNSVKPEGAFLLDEVSLKEYNNRIIKHFMQKYNDNVLLVADKLDIGKSTIYNLIKSGQL